MSFTVVQTNLYCKWSEFLLPCLRLPVKPHVSTTVTAITSPHGVFTPTPQSAYLPANSLVNDMPPLQILFLNKNDLFQKKVPISDIKSFFPVRNFFLQNIDLDPHVNYHSSFP